ncbi:YgfZ/GcvT domain-containing protein [Rhodospirillaceae bacterium SYSU D60014]|uniref:CAF17-like 4Fe-4S cluster assembly/insertion protein YgfZ n=1 Tax=Virgifigura deserti TaxID=2268457 RepID=UPI000E66E90B
MTAKSYRLAEERGVIAVTGEDRRSFLQGLVSNDVNKVSAERAVYAALLTPQGKYLHDFFIAEVGEALYLDCEAARREDLRRRLSIYKLRSKVSVTDATADFSVAQSFGTEALATLDLPPEPGHAVARAGGIVFTDPRLAELGARAILPREVAAEWLSAAAFTPAPDEHYDRLRLSLGIPDGSRDLPVEKAILLENGFEELHGVDWEKGCYMGQELTARTKYRGIVRKRLVPVEIEGPTPDWGTPILFDEKAAGEMRSGADGIGLAVLRLEYLDQAASPGAFRAGESRLTPRKPDWAVF